MKLPTIHLLQTTDDQIDFLFHPTGNALIPSRHPAVMAGDWYDVRRRSKPADRLEFLEIVRVERVELDLLEKQIYLNGVILDTFEEVNEFAARYGFAGVGDFFGKYRYAQCGEIASFDGVSVKTISPTCQK